jgi:hypothetical protein
MRPFPENLTFLAGLELSQAVLNPYSVDFVFTDMATRLVVEFRFEYVDIDGTVHAYDIQDEWAPVVFHPLIRAQDRITLVDVKEWRLSLTFASGRKLIVLSEEGPYESGQIHHGTALTVF